MIISLHVLSFMNINIFYHFLFKINNLSNPVKNAPKNVFIKTMAIFKNI